jgi:tetraacyldisaccharide 4'-kinase
MRPPGFWQHPPDAPGLAAWLLSPLGALTAAATARRVARGPGLRAAVPVVCAGNLTVGGAGKTPTVIALVQALARLGVAAAVVSRGHGGRLKGPVQVDPARHAAADVGDEPLLLAAFAPVVVGRDRAAAVQVAQALPGIGAVVMDDGFQNPAVQKDLSIVVVDAAAGWGNGRCLPAGPLREPVTAGLARADLVLSLGDPAAQAAFGARWGRLVAVPRLTAVLRPLATGMDWQGAAVLAFAGIARPQKFFDTLRGLGADLRATVALDDHQPLPEALLARLARQAEAAGAQLVTTEKDAVRLPAPWRRRVLTLPVRLVPDDPAALDACLTRALSGRA